MKKVEDHECELLLIGPPRAHLSHQPAEIGRTSRINQTKLAIEDRGTGREVREPFHYAWQPIRIISPAPGADDGR
jgi:hypothetical protein